MQSKLSKSELVAKNKCDTRLSARHEAIRALVLAPRAIKDTLDEIALDEDHALSTGNDATSLSETLESLRFELMAMFWNDLLQRIHGSNLSLQTVSLTMLSAIDLLNSLKLFISGMRNREEYIGSIITANSQNDEDIQRRIHLASTSFGRQRQRAFQGESPAKHQNFCTQGSNHLQPTVWLRDMDPVPSGNQTTGGVPYHMSPTNSKYHLERQNPPRRNDG